MVLTVFYRYFNFGDLLRKTNLTEYSLEYPIRL